MTIQEKFPDVWKTFLAENYLQDPDRNTRIKDWAEKFFCWLYESGNLSDIYRN